MHLQFPKLEARDGPPVTSNLTVAIAVAGGAAVVLILVVLYTYLKRYRLGHDTPPKFIPTSYLKKRWVNWKVRGVPPRRRTDGEHLEPISQSTTQSSQAGRRPRQSTASAQASTEDGPSGAAGIDRNTSVRSVMTLPVYRPKAGDTEQVLGREGERGGIDVVLQFPDIAEQEEEERRDEEMEALYQVRLARREDAAEREERRRLRRLARAGDVAALAQLRRQRADSNATNNERNIEALREEHQRVRERQRAVSSVSYGDLGVATHDGTRIRANSEESERPLLGDAASIATSSRHRRDRSVSSVVSIDTMNSDLPSPAFRRNRPDSRGESPRRRASGQAQMSSPEIIDADRDLASDGIPVHSPPDYENIELGEAHEPPPDYSSPVHEGNRGFSNSEIRESVSGARQPSGRTPRTPNLSLDSVPSIVVDTASPVTPQPH